MKTNHFASILAALLVSGALCHAIDRYVSLTGGHVAPFTNWADAATSIQAAIDAASAGDVIWVTNGVYATGGKVMAGDLTNRVALDKALAVQSVNGSSATIIQGQWDPITTNGPGAVRCAWLTNGAKLSGFTLQGGATRTNGDWATLQLGGGVWGDGVVTNCTIMQNSAGYGGGGAAWGAVNHCSIRDNRANYGGGVAYGNLNNCYLTGNSAKTGGAIYEANATNCALFRNSISGGLGGSGFYSDQGRSLVNCSLIENFSAESVFGGAGASGQHYYMQNCILWNNQNPSGVQNYYMGGDFAYCCTWPLPAGTGNISADPQLLADGVHLAATSSCRGAGSSLYVSGTDIDGQPWTEPPSMGCDEWYPEPLIILQPNPELATGTGQVRMSTTVAGQEPLYFFWTKDGAPVEDSPHYASTHTEDVLISGFGLTDTGAYRVVVTNAVGTATSEVAQVSIRCVDALGGAPTHPYTNWAMAATTIQDAIEAAALTDVVLVTNGVYATGGKVKAGSLTNRIALDKPILVTSVNGPQATVIQGQWDPGTTNGPAAVRCAWLGDGAEVSGFTLRDGATTSGDSGGGAWCASTNAKLANCVITNCQASSVAGGVYRGTLNRCTLVGNMAKNGGGAFYSFLLNCLITRNHVSQQGGGVAGGRLFNCALTENSSEAVGGGASVNTGDLFVNCTVTKNSARCCYGSFFALPPIGVLLTNCIVFFNSPPSENSLNFLTPAYTCSTLVGGGPGNISDDPQLVDDYHLAVTSPCRGMGSSLAAVGADIDGEPWASPPSMGCDEVWESGLTGPLSVSLTAAYPEVAAYGTLPLTGQIVGRALRLEWSFGDGLIFTNRSFVTSYKWTNPGDYTVTFTAFNTDNPSGVSTNLLVHVVPLESPALSVGGLSNTTFGLLFMGQPGVTYVVDQTTNLAPPVMWQTVQTLMSTGAVMLAADTKATNTMRFYRVRTQ